MTDLHVHILPGVDDGSPNLSTSLEMAEMAAQSGVRILAVTPHANQTGIEGVEDGYVNYESEQLEEQFYRLEREINREHIPISLVRGMEIMSIGPLEKKIRERKLIPLHESRYYLIEVPFDMAPDGIRKRLLEFPAMGKIPVLAHPERYFCVQDTPELYTNSGKWARFCRSTKEACLEDLEKRLSGQQGFYWKTALRAVWQAMPRSRLPDHGHAASPAVSGGAVWRSVCTAFSESESEKNPGGPSDFL